MMNIIQKRFEKLDIEGFSLNRIRYESNVCLSLYMSTPPDVREVYRGFELQFLSVICCIINIEINPWPGSIVSYGTIDSSGELKKALSNREIFQELGDYTAYRLSTDKGEIVIAARDFVLLKTKEIMRY